MTATTDTSSKRVVLLETDERAGLVAALAAACAAEGVSLEIVTGSGHVLITFQADDDALTALIPKLEAVPGVTKARPYTVARPRNA